jgi:hypothetical protein
MEIPPSTKILISKRQFNRPPPRRHIAKSFLAKPLPPSASRKADAVLAPD